MVGEVGYINKFDSRESIEVVAGVSESRSYLAKGNISQAETEWQEKYKQVVFLPNSVITNTEIITKTNSTVDGMCVGFWQQTKS